MIEKFYKICYINSMRIDSPKKRESTYPFLNLTASLKIAAAIKDLGGVRGNVQKSILAQHLKLPEDSGVLAQRIGAAKCYNLIQGWGAYSLTEDAKKYFFPTNEKDKLLASLSFIAAPLAFSKLIERFDGQKLPNYEMLGNIIHQEASVPLSWKERAASIFVNSAESIGIVDAHGILRHGATKHANSSDTRTLPEAEDSTPNTPPSNHLISPVITSISTPSVVKEDLNVWIFSHKEKTLKLETPKDLSTSMWDKLNAYVQLLKPTDEGE
jgi:hypothetical protein